MHDGQNGEKNTDTLQEDALESGQETRKAPLERASDTMSEAADAGSEATTLVNEEAAAAGQIDDRASGGVAQADALDVASEIDEHAEDRGHSHDGLIRGAEVAPDELGVSRIIEIAADAVAETSFKDLGLSEVLLEGVQARGYTRPTPVQAATFKSGREGRDLVVRSKTGTGKTAAFMLPLLERIPAGDRHTRAVILVPTRELAIQVADEGIALARYKDVSVVPIYGGVGLGLQADQLNAGAEVVVGTPGRMLDHIRRGNLDLSQATIAVLDEADEMLSMGFLEEVTSILKHLPAGHQTMMFSATIDASLAAIIRRFMTDPEEILLSTDSRTVDGIHNILYECSDSYPKARSLLYVLYLEAPESAIIFCNTRDDCSFVTAYLNRQGFDTEFINSDLPQKERERVMNRIKKGELSFLVATDIAARGIDISDLTHVINYSLPEDPDLYLHRVGRTGRIGKLGTAISLVSGRDLTAEMSLTRRFKIPFERKELPAPEEASRLWTEKHLVFLRETAASTAYEGFVPMAREMFRSLPEEERNRLVATALRIFFSWSRITRNTPQSEDDEGAEGGGSVDRESRGSRDGRRDSGRGRDRGGRGGRDSRDGGRRDERGPRDDRPRADDGRGPRRDERRPDERRPDERRPDERRPDERRPDDRRRDERPRTEGPARTDGSPRPEIRPRTDERPRPEGRVEGAQEPRREREPRPEGDNRRRDERPRPDGAVRRDEPRRDEPRRDDGRRPTEGEGPRQTRPSRDVRSDRDDRGNRSEPVRRPEPRREEGRREGGEEVAAREPRRPPEDLLDPLAAFAAANDIDLDSWIESEDFDESDEGLDDVGPAVAGEPNGEAGAEGQARARGRRRGGRRRRGRGSRRPGEGEASTEASSSSSEGGGSEGGGSEGGGSEGGGED